MPERAGIRVIIPSNEKYKGDALLQKSFTVDFLTKEKKKNEGKIPQYYVTGNHEAIILASTVRRYGCAIISLKKNVWLSVVDYLIVHYDGKVEFTFLDGSQIELNK